MSTGTDVQRQADRARSLRFAMACGAVIDVFLIAVDLAQRSATVLVPAFLLVLLLVLVFVETRVIRTLERAQELSRHADELEARVQELDRARPCSHASAEPVDLFNPSTGERDGERVAWVCPDCNAELPAGWAPVKKVLRAEGNASDTLTATATWTTGPALTGSGSLSAKATWDDVAYASEASQHFAELAKVGLKHCLSYCPFCAERDERQAPGGPALDFLREHEARIRSVILAPKPDLGDGRGDLARDMRDLADLERIGASRPVPWCQEHMCAVTECPPFPDLPPDESEQR